MQAAFFSRTTVMVSINVSGVPWRKCIGGNRRSYRNVYPAISEEGAPHSAKTNRCVVRENLWLHTGTEDGQTSANTLVWLLLFN